MGLGTGRTNHNKQNSKLYAAYKCSCKQSNIKPMSWQQFLTQMSKEKECAKDLMRVDC